MANMPSGLLTSPLFVPLRIMVAPIIGDPDSSRIRPLTTIPVSPSLSRLFTFNVCSESITINDGVCRCGDRVFLLCHCLHGLHGHAYAHCYAGYGGNLSEHASDVQLMLYVAHLLLALGACAEAVAFVVALCWLVRYVVGTRHLKANGLGATNVHIIYNTTIKGERNCAYLTVAIQSSCRCLIKNTICISLF